MTAHTCTTLNPGCYRCELHKDEVNGWIDSLLVTRRGVVHDPDCSHVSGPCSSATKWMPTYSRSDRACLSCLPDGLPERAA